MARPLAEALDSSFTVVVCSEPDRARALIDVASFQAIVVVAELITIDEGGPPVVRAATTADPATVRDDVTAAVRDRTMDECRTAGALSALTELTYDEYIDLVRFRATRQYLLALMQRHQGSVSEASRTAGMMRESLHRLMRRHNVEAEQFREVPR